MNSPAVFQAATAGTWPARLELQVGRRGDSSRLRRCHHRGPLYVQRAFYPEGEDLAHLYLLHPPGGVVSGDALQIRVECQQDARALVTTPGAGRIYRARDTLPLQQQKVELRLQPGASLEWFPLETIVYDGACVDMGTAVHLAKDSAFIGWELACFGLPASGAPFSRGSFRQCYRIFREGVPLFIDALDIDDSNRDALLSGPAAMRGSAVSGFFLAGPFAREQGRALIETIRGLQVPDAAPADSCAISQVGDLLVGRYLGGSAERARCQFARWWQVLRPALLSRQACPPRIWLT
ncbi:urease accessory protein UreD [Haliea sp. E17]|uniref:urease accessory protein UreD n=1 Tax=Haliea sp. E17 TaxID=3401576 RepID=UPI003AAFDCD3